MTIKEACELFDAEVLTDLAGDDLHQVYFIGVKPEYGAGLVGDDYTPYFRTMDDLERYCSENEPVLEKLAKELFW